MWLDTLTIAWPEPFPAQRIISSYEVCDLSSLVEREREILESYS